MKPRKPTKKDKAWQQKIEKRVNNEKIVLDHSQGKERFDRVLKNAQKKK